MLLCLILTRNRRVVLGLLNAGLMILRLFSCELLVNGSGLCRYRVDLLIAWLLLLKVKVAVVFLNRVVVRVM